MRREEEDIPSENAVDEWIYAHGVGEGCYEDGHSFTGKWLIWASWADVDERWKQIKQATEAGQLGVSAKVSTIRPNAYKRKDHVIEVYTSDYRDEASVGGVLRGLRRLGISGVLYYKTEQDTISGVYSSEGPYTKKKGPSSRYTSDYFEKPSL